MSAITQEAILDALPHASGYDRVYLIQALAWAPGSAAVPALMELSRASGPGSAVIRSVALFAIARICRADALDRYVEALSDNAFNTQITAAVALAEHGDSAIGKPFMEWFRKKLARRNREQNFDPREVPSALLYCLRNAAVPTFRQIVMDQKSWLDTDETAWLRRHGVLDRSRSAVSRSTVSEWLHECDFDGPLEDARVAEIIAKAQRRSRVVGRTSTPSP